MALTIVDAFAKFKERGFISKTTTWPRPHPFRRKFFTLGMGLAVVDPLAKFKQHSLIHSRNIEIYKNLKKGYVTQTTPLSSGNFYSCGGTCCS